MKSAILFFSAFFVCLALVSANYTSDFDASTKYTSDVDGFMARTSTLYRVTGEECLLRCGDDKECASRCVPTGEQGKVGGCNEWNCDGYYWTLCCDVSYILPHEPCYAPYDCSRSPPVCSCSA